MLDGNALKALSALAQPHRMAIFRMLMRMGPVGLPAGEIGDHLELAPSKVSFHVGQLERAGLLRSWRVQRNIFYAVDVDGTRDLMQFLTNQCSDGHPEITGALFEDGKPFAESRQVHA